MARDQPTPMMRQYAQMKAQIPAGTLLLFRLGDFYELFEQDAIDGSKILDLTLTQRNGTPMCGVPFHAAAGYISRLIAAGRRVALCDQTETPKPGQIVRRDIVQVVSPGTIVEPDALEGSRPHYVAALCPGKGDVFGLALLDTSTGEFRVCELRGLPETDTELAKIRPAELIFPEEWDPPRDLGAGHRYSRAPHEGWQFQIEAATASLRDHFKTQSLDGFGARELTVGLCAAGALLSYVGQTLRRPLHHVHRLQVYAPAAFMLLDETTRRTLELVEPASRMSGREATLLGTLDFTLTPMGARRLRDWILHPLRDLDPILQRQHALRRLVADDFPLTGLREALGGVRDVERCLGRLAQGSGNGRDLLALATSLEQTPALTQHLAPTDPPPLFETLRAQLDPVPEATELIRRAINPECPALLRDGNVIAPGFDPALDEFRAAGSEGKSWIAQLQAREQQRTGIKSLKVGFNSVFGYYIEVTKANLASVPPEYHRKQTTANAERFITPELKEMEAKILGAEDKARALEQQLFESVRSDIVAHAARIQATASAIGAIDALASLAEAARVHGYLRPELVDEPLVDIAEGRHPVLERLARDERFVPNDTRLDPDVSRLILLTGPNMAGKSTYLRQVALIVLMAHMGSFVPAQEARIGLVDRIFTRVGASDDLARGQSTFMVEMNETANILNHATRRSLVVLDEIGRGTSTFDGVSIAWAIAEYLHDHLQPLTLFATHYHETAALQQRLPACKLMHVAVREWNDQVVFLRKVLEGAIDKSYGIQVARLAGLPKPVIERAKAVLAHLETSQIAADTLPESDPAAEGSSPARAPRPRRASDGLPAASVKPQLDLFLNLPSASSPPLPR